MGFKFIIKLWVVILLLQMNGYNGCSEKERLALLAIKSFFKSVSNEDAEKYMLTSWVDDDRMSDCCGWEKVKCNITTRLVTELSLNDTRYDYNFDGVAILNFSLFLPFEELQALDLSFNHFDGFDGNEGNDKFGSLKHMKILNLGYNKFNYSILPYTTALTSLTTLILEANEMEGFFNQMEGLEILRNLEMLDLSDNRLSGTLQDLGICELKNLVELDLNRNKFDGFIPQCLSNLTFLQVLDLSSNNLKGNIPSSVIGTLTSLRYLSLPENDFEGLFSFSTPLASLSKLEVLRLSMMQVETENWLSTSQFKVIYLRNCNLYGTIPSFLLNQYDLRVIDLSHNKLVGAFPTWLLQNNPKLEAMYLTNNSFTGEIPQFPNPSSSHNFSLLDISSNDFQGNIPSSICDIPGLQLLNLSNNNFSGEIPRHFAMGCSSLSFLYLSHNKFRGRIFADYMNLIRLRYLYLDNNNFSGEIGDGLSNATRLEVLDISNNKVSGQIPHWIGNFSSLGYLLMSNNLLEGSIPIELSSVLSLELLDLSQNRLSGSFNISPSLKHLYMQENGFSGSIPTALFTSSELLTLDLRDNNFVGSIPQDWINNHSNMRVLLLRGNNLQGLIPDQLCQLRKLGIVDLSRNILNGPIPLCFTNMLFWMVEDEDNLYGDELRLSYRFLNLFGPYIDYTLKYLWLDLSEEDIEVDQRLQVKFMTKNRYESYEGSILNYMSGLDLSSNELTGDIPSEIGQLQKLHALNLSHNYLSGSIPESFSHLKAIESVDLSSNELNGQIPQQLSNLNFLSYFNVSYNNLSGPTPNGGQFSNFDESNYGGGNLGLCGAQIKKSCTSLEVEAPPTTNGTEEEDESAIDMVAFSWSFVVSFIMSILGLFATLWINPYWRNLWFYFIEKCIRLCYP